MTRADAIAPVCPVCDGTDIVVTPGVAICGAECSTCGWYFTPGDLDDCDALRRAEREAESR